MTPTQEVAGKLACHREEHLAQLRRWAVTDAVSRLRAGAYHDALHRITDSVLGEQARLAGIYVDVP